MVNRSHGQPNRLYNLPFWIQPHSIYLFGLPTLTKVVTMNLSESGRPSAPASDSADDKEIFKLVVLRTALKIVDAIYSLKNGPQGES